MEELDIETSTNETLADFPLADDRPTPSSAFMEGIHSSTTWDDNGNDRGDAALIGL